MLTGGRTDGVKGRVGLGEGTLHDRELGAGLNNAVIENCELLNISRHRYTMSGENYFGPDRILDLILDAAEEAFQGYAAQIVHTDWEKFSRQSVLPVDRHIDRVNGLIRRSQGGHSIFGLGSIV